MRFLGVVLCAVLVFAGAVFLSLSQSQRSFAGVPSDGGTGSARSDAVRDLKHFLAERHRSGTPPRIRLAAGKSDRLPAPPANSGATGNAGAGDDLLLEPETEKPAVASKPAAKTVAAGKPATSASDDDLLAGDNSAGDPEKSDDDLLADGGAKSEKSKKGAALAVNKSAPESDEQPELEAGKEASEARQAHLELFVEGRFPSANACAACHPRHYREWSVSQHAYAQLSPVYLSLNNKINELTNGSNGDFCLRCHTPVGAILGESSFMSNLDRHPTSREGITCIVCHRISKTYNKVSGRLALVEGAVTEPVFGPTGNKELRRVLSRPDKYRVVTDPKESGRQIHKKAKLFENISKPTFCGTCHDVTLFNGFRLEEAFSEYRLSPAAKKGVTCQDCHMGKVQGKPSGYAHGPAAIVGEVPTKSRKLTNHMFPGPDFSVVHPGIFPHNPEAAAFKTLREWLQFKHTEGWGTDKFENAVADGYKFPKAWESIDDRYDAREILKKQFKLLKFARKKRQEILRNGYLLGSIITERADAKGISFRVQVKNGTDGHNVPTGFTGERLVWLDVTVRDQAGKVIFRSGDRDPNGDLRDGHSSYVHAGKIALDSQLFSLQSIFLTQNGRGGEIEHVIPIPYPVFALPRVLPSATSLIFTGEPATERSHKKGIEPLGERWGRYKIKATALTGNGPYKATIKLMEQPAPVNLLIAMQSVGFDYGITPRQAGDALIAGAETLWQKTLTFDIPKTAVPAPAAGAGSARYSDPSSGDGGLESYR